MPTKLHRILEREADRKGLSGERKKAYVYGTIAKMKAKKEAKKERQG